MRTERGLVGVDGLLLQARALCIEHPLRDLAELLPAHREWLCASPVRLLPLDLIGEPFGLPLDLERGLAD